MQINPQARIRPVTAQRRRGEKLASDTPEFSLEEKVQSTVSGQRQQQDQSPEGKEKDSDGHIDVTA